MINTNVLILGAGLAGIELGRRLSETNDNFIILEKENQVGGMCRTNRTGDYYWDFAVHALYSKEKTIMDYLLSLPIDYEHHKRHVKIVHSYKGKRRLLDYPFESGIKDLPLSHKLECVFGYLNCVKRKKDNASLRSWIDTHLGPGVAKHFMIPYNSKIWNCQLCRISSSLVSCKIEPASLKDFLLSALGKSVVGRAYQAEFVYPVRGIQELIDYSARNIQPHIKLDTIVDRLRRDHDRWVVTTSDGSEYCAETVISTIPLVELLKKVDVKGVNESCDVFKWNNTYFVMVGLKQGCNFEFIKDCHWVFFKEDEIFYRVTLMNNFGKDSPPTLVAEITKKDDINSEDEECIKDLVLSNLLSLGIIADKNHIAIVDIKLLNYTYPIPTPGLESVKKDIADNLKQQNLFLLGRNGNWDYINMDGIINKVEKFIEENPHLKVSKERVL
ncbi:protoporphyrinogen/coproporphyrinogen oxidase [Candidatus Omnitrophota bacterium]